MFKELRLTSPHMKGPNVRKAQKALDHNRFGNFYEGKIDGVYGDHTAGATKEAKFKLGYPKRKIDQHYDERLDNHLNNRHDLSPLMKRRRSQRKHDREKDKGIKLRALDIALRDVGVHETGGDHSKYTAWYGFDGPWCLMFVSYCEVMAGSHIFAKGSRYAYNPNLTSAAQHGYGGMRLTSAPERGDLVQYQFDPDPMSDHVGIFIEWTGASHSSFRAVEGNTDGGRVAVNTRSRSLVSHFIRLPS